MTTFQIEQQEVQNLTRLFKSIRRKESQLYVKEDQLTTEAFKQQQDVIQGLKEDFLSQCETSEAAHLEEVQNLAERI